MAEEEAEPVVAAVPVLGVEPGHLAEARRALLAQGRNVDDDALARVLWAARALPAALDALADARSGTAVGEAALGAPTVEIGAGGGGMMVAIARLEGPAIVVELVEERALFAAGGDDAVPACTVTIPLSTAPARDVAVHRFTLGPAG